MLDRGAPRHFPESFRMKWLLSHFHVHFDFAGSHKTCGASLACSWPAAFYLYISAEDGFCDMAMSFSIAHACTKRGVRSWPLAFYV